MRISKKISDRELVLNYANGDEQSLAELVNRRQRQLLYHINCWVNDYDVANDILQESFFRFIKIIKSNDYKPNTIFYSFIKKIAQNLSISYLRESKKIPRNSGKENWCIFENLYTKQENFLDILDKKEKLILLKNAFEKLPNKHKEIFKLRLVENRSFKEISELHKTTVSACIGKFRYAVLHLKKIVKTYDLENELL